jgi:hypothetical protein
MTAGSTLTHARAAPALGAIAVGAVLSAPSRSARSPSGDCMVARARVKHLQIDDLVVHEFALPPTRPESRNPS